MTLLPLATKGGAGYQTVIEREPEIAPRALHPDAA